MMSGQQTESPVFTIDRQDLYGTWHSETPPPTPRAAKSTKTVAFPEPSERIRIPDEKASTSSDTPTGDFYQSAPCKCLAVLICALFAVAIYLFYKKYLYEPPVLDATDQ